MVTLSPTTRFVGVEDDNLDLFEGQYPLPKGVSYNSYLISTAEKIAVIDAVDRRRCDDWLANLVEALSGSTPDYLVIQHVEPDHSGSIDMFLKQYPTTRVVATAKAVGMLGNFFENVDFASRSIVVKDGDTLDLGGVTLEFVTAPMVHWPEVMLTLNTTEGILFSADAFGSFAMYSSTGAWDDEARRYYCNIVGKYGVSVQNLLKKLAKREIKTIAPLHGPVLSENLGHYISLYDRWSRYEPETEGVLGA